MEGAEKKDPVENLHNDLLTIVRRKFDFETAAKAQQVSRGWRQWIKSSRIPTDKCIDEIESSAQSYKFVCNNQGYKSCIQPERVQQRCEDADTIPSDLSTCFACHGALHPDNDRKFSFFDKTYFLCIDCFYEVAICDFCDTEGIRPYNTDTDGEKCPDGPFFLHEYDFLTTVDHVSFKNTIKEPIFTCNKEACRERARTKALESLKAVQ